MGGVHARSRTRAREGCRRRPSRGWGLAHARKHRRRCMLQTAECPREGAPPPRCIQADEAGRRMRIGNVVAACGRHNMDGNTCSSGSGAGPRTMARLSGEPSPAGAQADQASIPTHYSKRVIQTTALPTSPVRARTGSSGLATMISTSGNTARSKPCRQRDDSRYHVTSRPGMKQCGPAAKPWGGPRQRGVPCSSPAWPPSAPRFAGRVVNSVCDRNPIQHTQFN